MGFWVESLGFLLTKISLEGGGGLKGSFCPKNISSYPLCGDIRFSFQEIVAFVCGGGVLMHVFIFEFTSGLSGLNQEPKCLGNLKGAYKIQTWPRRSPKIRLNKKERSGSKVYIK